MTPGVLFLLASLLPLAFSRNCTDLSVYDGDKRLNVTVPIIQSENCRYGPPGGFPPELSAGYSVSSARDFRVTPHDPVAIHFKWKVQLDGVSRAYLKGFYLELHIVGSGQAFCVIFDLRGLNLTGNTEIHFSYTCNLEKDSDETYRVLLLSLPPPSQEEYKKGLQERTVVTVPRRSDQSSVYPAKWTTTITVQPHAKESKMEVKFGLPGNGSLAKFDTYTVELVKPGEPGIPEMRREVVKKIYLKIDDKAPRKEFGELNFTDVKAGTYFVQVQPKDTYMNDRAKCLCFKMVKVGPGMTRDCETCRVSQTQQFNFTGAEEPPIGAEEPPIGAEKPPIGAEKPPIGAEEPPTTSYHSPSIYVSDIVAGVIVPVLFVAMLIVVICIWKRHRAAKQACLRENKPPDGIEEISSLDVSLAFPLSNGQLTSPTLSRKTVFLLASEDHKYFSQALHHFSTFLSLHCQCDVMFASQQLNDVHRTNSYIWVSSKIDTADFVIIVASEAAYHQFKAFQNRAAYKSADLGPTGDVFTLGLVDICGKIASGADVSKVIMVHFEHTAPDFRLPIPALPQCFYQLPTRLRSFLCHVHGLDDSTMDLMRVNLPLQGNVEELEGGREWLTAVEKCKVFQRERPQWFEQKFGRAISMNYSTDSGFGEGFARQNSSQTDDIIHELQAARPCTRNSSFTKSDFIPPSVCDANSVQTVPCPIFPPSDMPPEIDQGCTVSDKFRMINENYEKDRRQEGEKESNTVSEEFRMMNDNYEQDRRQENEEHHLQRQAEAEAELRSAISDQTDYPFSQQNFCYPARKCELTFHQPEDYDSDCVSVSSAQSV